MDILHAFLKVPACLCLKMDMKCQHVVDWNRSQPWSTAGPIVEAARATTAATTATNSQLSCWWWQKVWVSWSCNKSVVMIDFSVAYQVHHFWFVMAEWMATERQAPITNHPCCPRIIKGVLRSMHIALSSIGGRLLSALQFLRVKPIKMFVVNTC